MDRKLKILLVDDNQDSVLSMAMLLRLDGSEVAVANDGREAIRLSAEFRPDVILLDIGLPGMNGYEVARLIRGNPELTGVQMYAVTGYGSREDRARALEAGFDGHFSKPMEYAQLQTLVSSGIAGRAANRSTTGAGSA